MPRLRKKPQNAELKRELDQRIKATWGDAPGYDGLGDFEKLKYLEKLCADIRTYDDKTGDTRFNYEKSYFVQSLMPHLRKKLADAGTVVVKNEHGDYVIVEDFWSGARILPLRLEGCYPKLADAVKDSYMNSRQIEQAAGIGKGVLSSFLHGRTDPCYHTGEWTETTLRLCTVLGCSPEEVFPEEIWLSQQQRAYRHSIMDTVASNDAHNSNMRGILRREVESMLRAILKTLTPNERRVLIYRFGLFGHPQLLLEEVAKLYGRTRERIRQIEAKALRKMRHPCRLRVIDGYTREDTETAEDKVIDAHRPSNPNQDIWSD